ncbi:hypothetical protein CYMTET_17010 [Cymbomonas tetramitiformis]|uniref:Tail specific protease domain-containing protein n=1 Tax=Cymbomonas tetramitiformis TaxID=36881 RepID=A0AAE0L7E0_9CHLO|nr:hypothetical protein CYMTET_17010 [Cymbomonas tetramitiformis]
MTQLRRPDGTDVAVTTKRFKEGPKSPVTARLNRLNSAAYIRLSEFNGTAEREVANAIERLQSEGATSIVLDLRDNGGGLVQAGVEIARLFLEPENSVVYTEGRTGTARAGRTPTVVARRAEGATRLPLTVLVNGRTARQARFLQQIHREMFGRPAIRGLSFTGRGAIVLFWLSAVVCGPFPAPFPGGGMPGPSAAISWEPGAGSRAPAISRAPGDTISRAPGAGHQLGAPVAWHCSRLFQYSRSKRHSESSRCLQDPEIRARIMSARDEGSAAQCGARAGEAILYEQVMFLCGSIWRSGLQLGGGDPPPALYYGKE